MRFGTKVDLWLQLVLAGALLVQIGAGLAVGLEGGPSAAVGVWALGLVLDGLIFGLLVVPLYYEIAETELLVRSGQLRWRVPLAGIQSVRPTRNPLSAPALSLDRLEIDYHVDGASKSLLISPADRSAFCDRLLATTRGLVKDGDSLVRRA